MLNMSNKLREERQKNSEKLIEKTKEKAASNKAKQLLNEKLTASKDGTIYLNHTEIQTMIEAAKENNDSKTNTKEQAGVGANLDLQA